MDTRKRHSPAAYAVAFTLSVIIGCGAAKCISGMESAETEEAVSGADATSAPKTPKDYGLKAGHASVYDGILRYYADSIGWDWRMLAAIAYTESGFDPEAVSHKGAVGLMQLMPLSAEDMGVSDFEDPIRNITAGARLLSTMYSHFGKMTSDETERLKLTLAAYNAGEGRIMGIAEYVNKVMETYVDFCRFYPDK